MSRLASLALLAAVALPLVVGCQFLVFKICIKNDTSFYLDEVAIKEAGAPTYPPSAVDPIAPDSSDVIGGISAGEYDIRATFDAESANRSTVVACEAVIELTNVEIESTNLCVTFAEQDEGCVEIYYTLDYVL